MRSHQPGSRHRQRHRGRAGRGTWWQDPCAHICLPPECWAASWAAPRARRRPRLRSEQPLPHATGQYLSRGSREDGWTALGPSRVRERAQLLSSEACSLREGTEPVSSEFVAEPPGDKDAEPCCEGSDEGGEDSRGRAPCGDLAQTRLLCPPSFLLRPAAPPCTPRAGPVPAGAWPP